MIVDFEVKDIELTKEEMKIVHNKFVKRLEKLLPDFDDDIKKALVKIKKDARFGFIASFEMWLPKNKQIFAEGRHKELMGSVSELDKRVVKQIRNYKERLTSHK